MLLLDELLDELDDSLLEEEELLELDDDDELLLLELLENCTPHKSVSKEIVTVEDEELLDESESEELLLELLDKLLELLELDPSYSYLPISGAAPR